MQSTRATGGSVGELSRLAALAWLCGLLGAGLFAAEGMPPKPQRHFNDYANAISGEVEQRLNRRLEDLEKTNSTQVVVAIFKKMQSDSSIEDYTQRVAQNWGVGQKERNNGAVLFIFIDDRKMFLQTGYGLEGALPDATAKDITEFRIKPHFRNGDYDRGVSAGVDAIIRAVGGEYKAARGQRRGNTKWIPVVILLLFVLAIASTRRRKRGWVYGGAGRHGWGGPIIWTGGGGGWGSGGGGGGGGGGGWGGGFSGGGGSFGGGGAGSSW